MELKCQLYFLLFERFRGFWDLTCDSWAEFEEKKKQRRQRQWIQSLSASPARFGRGRFAAGFWRRARSVVSSKRSTRHKQEQERTKARARTKCGGSSLRSE